MDDAAFTRSDLEQITRHGLDEVTVRRQLELLRRPPPGTEVVRPATVGDGIVRLGAADGEGPQHAELLDLYETAVADGRFGKLVPASGAASRMFRSLMAVRHGQALPDDDEACRRFLRNLDRVAFADELGSGDRSPPAMLRRLLDDDALGYANRPKGLVPFHRYEPPDAGAAEKRTPFEEHLAEAAMHVRDAAGRCRVHFTILEQHEDLFRSFWAERRKALEERFSACFDVGLSFQEPSTDTVAADLEGRPFRSGDGRLVFRPGGHGALIRNLGNLAGDLVFVKNIDNVVPDDRKDVVVHWKKLLGGYLLWLERTLVELLERAVDDRWIGDARRFLRHDLGLPTTAVPASPGGLRRRLECPLRVCGVVAVTGEPGGGPFWIRDAEDGESLQIVETSQIDTSRPEQAENLARSTHFNPVDLVCRLRDHRGRPFDLERYVDPQAVFISQKSYHGHPLRALEHPGLWNGAMARWNTVFVEVPGATFAPVKTVLDLLRPEHQAGGAAAEEGL